MKKSLIKKKMPNLKSGKSTLVFSYQKKVKVEQLRIDIDSNISESIIKIDDKAKQQEQIEFAEESVGKQKSKKKKIINAIFFILNIVVVAGILFYQLSNETVTSISDLKDVKFYYIPVVFAMFGIIMLIDAHRTNLFLKKSGNRSRPYLCYKMCAIGKYYDNITPMSSGGEPSQIFYMNHRGLDAGTSISVPMGRYVVSQISWMIIGLIAVFVIIFTQVMDISVVLVIGLLGFAANFILLSVCLILSMSKKIGNKLVAKILKFLQKIHIVKHYEKQYEKVMKVVENYQNTMKTYAKNKWFFLYTIFLSILIFVITYTMPFIIYLLLGGKDYSLWGNMLVFSLMIELGSSIIPLPGGTGMNEISFTVVFADVFPHGSVFWGLLFWRFMTYYIFILQGIIIVIYDYFIGNRKFLWLQKKWELETESLIFKDEQLKKFKKANKKIKKL